METNNTFTIHHSWYQCGENAAAPLWMRILALIISSVSIPIGSIGNLTALIAFMSNRSLWQFSNVNLFLLTMNDVILTLFVCPHYVVKYWLGCWPLSQYYCNVYTFFLASSYISSLNLIALIAYERYLIVKLGASYRQQQSWQTVLLRAIPLGICLPYFGIVPLCFTNWYQYFMPHNAEGEFIARIKCMPHANMNGYIYALATWVIDFVPIGIMLVCYISVFRRRGAWAKKEKVQNHVGLVPRKQTLTTTGMAMVSVVPVVPFVLKTTKSTETTRTTTKTENRRAARLLNLMFGTVVVTQLPYVIMSFVTSLIMMGAAPNLNRFWWVSLHELSSMFAAVNMATNPLVYAYTMPDFDRAARNLWRPVLTGLRRVWRWMFKKARKTDLVTTRLLVVGLHKK